PQTCAGRQMQPMEKLVFRRHAVHALRPKTVPLKLLKLRTAQQVSFRSLAHSDSVDGSQICGRSFCGSRNEMGRQKGCPNDDSQSCDCNRVGLPHSLSSTSLHLKEERV